MNKNRWGTVNSRSRVRVKAPGVLRRQGKYPDEEGGWGGVFATWVYPLLPDMIPSHLVHTLPRCAPRPRSAFPLPSGSRRSGT